VDPRASLDDVEKKKKFLTLPGLEPRLLGRPAHCQSLCRLRYPGAIHGSKNLLYFKGHTGKMDAMVVQHPPPQPRLSVNKKTKSALREKLCLRSSVGNSIRLLCSFHRQNTSTCYSNSTHESDKRGRRHGVV
jgi:hypothetical protein